MSFLLNSNQAQERHGINRSTTRRWIKDGRLVADADGYFEESDFLVIARKSRGWAKRRQNKALAERQVAPELLLGERGQTMGEVLPDDLDELYTPSEGSAVVGPGASKNVLDRAAAYQKFREHERKNNIAAGKLISRSLVNHYVGRLGEIDNVEWRSMSARINDDLMGLCGVSDAGIASKVTKRIDEEVFKILQSVAAAQREFLGSLPVEEV